MKTHKPDVYEPKTAFLPPVLMRLVGVDRIPSAGSTIIWVVLGLCVCEAAGIVWDPFGTAVLSAAVSLGALAFWFSSSLPGIFSNVFKILLLGYALLGRGFAYLGFHPLYIGEAVMALGILSSALNGSFRSALRSRLSWMIILFALWGAFRTVPYLGSYGVLALRDAALWGYAVFALLVAGLLLQANSVRAVLRQYGNWLPLFIVWVPVAFILSMSFSELIPYIAGPKVPLLNLKPGDMAVHLTGVSSFLALGLYRSFRQEAGSPAVLRENVLAILCLVGILMVASFSRGALVTFLLGLLALAIARPIRHGMKLLAFCVILVVSLFLFRVELDTGGSRRISLTQLADNTRSILGGQSDISLEGTRRWRLAWWNRVVGYTFGGEYFWTGKGYGINLADSDGFQTYSDHSLRSPHNGHLTILARSGVPGLVLWIVLQVSFAVMLLQAYVRARKLREDLWERVNLWMMIYWLAFMTNSAFDVFLEGPQGGIWFWSLFGFGIAALEAQRNMPVEDKAHA